MAKHSTYNNRIVILGFGSIGAGVLPLLLKHFDSSQILVIGGDDRNADIARNCGVTHVIQPLDQENYDQVLANYLKPTDFLVNLSVDVSSLALIDWCHANEVFYLDTCIEPWPGFYTDTLLPPALRSNYALRQAVLDRRDQLGTSGPTAIIAHGANPGLVNHFVKRALIDIGLHFGVSATPSNRTEWCDFAETLGLKVIHIAERDTQTPKTPKKVGEFVNTWSVDGFISEGLQPSEMGWGSHEKHLPLDGNKFSWGCDSAIWLNQPGCVTRVRSWTPQEGPYHGWIITHNESIGIADYFTSENGYRPTVHYAYHPCDSAVLSLHEMAGKNYEVQKEKRLIVEEVVSGVDELGVLLMGKYNGENYAYWYGSLLDIDTARQLAPYNNATSLQVTAPVLAGILWAIDNPGRGILEADELPYEEILAITDPYMGQMIGEWTDWTPLQDRGTLFPEDLDTSDPWQFKNFRVS
jgi:homospermidine synthase